MKKVIKATLRTCKNRHKYYKSSDCPTCPVCENSRKPGSGFLALIAAPARRALEREGITSLKDLSAYSEKEILNLHGMGKSTLPKLKEALRAEGLSFKTEVEIKRAAYQTYNDALNAADKAICDLIALTIEKELSGAVHKIWHAHPVWFIQDNPIVGYSKQKNGIRLMFWSGADFNEEGLAVRGQKFKDASVFYTELSSVSKTDLKRWLKKSVVIQWDYKNLVKRKGKLERL